VSAAAQAYATGGWPAGEYPYGEAPARRPAVALYAVPDAPPGPPVPTFTPHERPRPVLVSTSDPAALQRAAGALRGLDWARVQQAQATQGLTYAGTAAGGTPIGSALEAERARSAALLTAHQPVITRPEPVAAAEPDEPASPADTRPPLRFLLADALWAACQWYDTVDYGADWQDNHAAKAAVYLDLHDAVGLAPTDAAALDLIYTALAEGTAEVGDLFPHSPGRLGGAR